MTTTSNPIQGFSPFLGASSNIPEEDDRAKVFLQDQFSNFADIINDKKIGVYSQGSENFNGNKFFYLTPTITRNGYQAMTFIPSLPNTGSLTITLTGVPVFPVPNINPEFVVTHVWGSASRPCGSVGAIPPDEGDYFSFYSKGNPDITFTMSNTEIVITTTIDLSEYSGMIVVEYLRNGL